MSQADSDNIRTEPGSDPADTLYTRRAVLRRSFLGITAVGLAGLLAACGNDDDDEEDPAGDGGGDSDSSQSSDGEDDNGSEDEETEED